MRSVLIVQPYVPAYRVPLFETMRRTAFERGLELTLLAGRPSIHQASRGDAEILEWATYVRSWSSPLHGFPLRFKALPPKVVGNAELVVGEQSVGAAENWFFAAGRRLCLWGHGYRAVGGYSRVDDVLETALLRRSRHFFAYTERGRDHALARGLDPEQVTVLWNTVDTDEIVEARSCVTREEVEEFRTTHGLDDGPVVAFIGGLDAVKRIDLLLNAALELRRRIPGLKFLIAGDGAARDGVARFTAEYPWARWLGRVDAYGKALLSACCAVLLNPGRVGLVAVDSFAMCTPIVTTRWTHHAPEFDYLDDKNSVITNDTFFDFVEGVERLLGDAQHLTSLRAGCDSSARRFGIDAMASRFLDGIDRALPAV